MREVVQNRFIHNDIYWRVQIYIYLIAMYLYIPITLYIHIICRQGAVGEFLISFNTHSAVTL